MASAFWILEDGRTYARRWSRMAYILELITNELKLMKGAEAFYEYLEQLVYREENGDIYNGYGGFIRGEENIMFNFDLRTFTSNNREYFWVAAQKALAKLILQKNDANDYALYDLTVLMDMNKRIKKGEDPSLLNDIVIILQATNEKIGPGWED